MTGREERKQKVQRKIEEKIAQYPQSYHLRDFYVYMGQMSHNTQYDYINKIIVFLKTV